MRKYRTQIFFCLSAAAFMLAAGVSANRSLAYFTTYTSAYGEAVLHLGFTTTEIEEEIEGWIKRVRISNTGEQECYVRVQAFAGKAYQDSLVYMDGSGKWSLGEGGYYYYNDILAPGAVTEELLIQIDHKQREQDFNVIVVQEHTPVLYREDGQPEYNWDIRANTGERGRRD